MGILQSYARYGVGDGQRRLTSTILQYLILPNRLSFRTGGSLIGDHVTQPLGFIIHNLQQAQWVAQAADLAGVSVLLLSPRDGARSLGPEIFLSIIQTVKNQYPGVPLTGILDCGKDAGTALTALRRGAVDISVDLPVSTRDKIIDMANQLNGSVRTYPDPIVDLAHLKRPDRDVLGLMTEHVQK